MKSKNWVLLSLAGLALLLIVVLGASHWGSGEESSNSGGEEKSLRQQSSQSPEAREEFDGRRRLGPGERQNWDRSNGNEPNHQQRRRRGDRFGYRRGDEEFMEWLREHRPERAKELSKLKEHKPELYERLVRLSYRKHRRIMEAERENPKLAEVLREDLQLRDERDELLGRMKQTKDEAEKDELTEQLRDIVGSRFDLLVKRKEIIYEGLLEKLEQLRKEVKRSEAEVDKWKQEKFKNKSVNERVEELLKRRNHFTWE